MSRQSSLEPEIAKGNKRLPSDSQLYDKLIPIALILLAVVAVALILVALGVLLGLITF